MSKSVTKESTVRVCEICGKPWNGKMFGNDLRFIPACTCVLDIRNAKDAERAQELRLIKARWLLPNVRAFGGATCAGATFALATDADIKAAEREITPVPHAAIIRSQNELTTKEVCVCMSKKLIAEGYSTIPIDVHQVLAEEDWSELYKAEVVILHKLDDLPLGSKEQDKIFTLVDRRYRSDSERFTWATTSKPASELPLAWGKELSRQLTEECVFIQL
jgi:hypothetical protein